MNLLINTASTFKGGGVQVALSFILSCREFHENTYHVVLSPTLAGLVREEDFGPNFTFYRLDYRPGSKVFSFRSHDSFFRRLEARVNPDCVFTTSGPAYWRPRAPHLVGFNLPHHVYPDSPFFRIIGVKDRFKWMLKRKFHLYFFNREADALVAQTEDVAARLQVLFPQIPVYTVSNTYSKFFESLPGDKSKLPPRVDGEFRLLLLSAYHRHKNFEILNAVVPRLVSRGFHNVRLITTIDNRIAVRIFTPAVREMLYNLGPIPVNECPAVYRDVDAVFLPSLLECFSANYPEAMVMRKPILTSDLGFARTVCGDAALYFDSTDPNDISKKIESIVTHESLRDQLTRNGLERLKRFPNSMDRAVGYLRICAELCEQAPNLN